MSFLISNCGGILCPFLVVTKTDIVKTHMNYTTYNILYFIRYLDLLVAVK